MSQVREVRSTGPRTIMRVLAVAGFLVLHVPLLILAAQSFRGTADGWTLEWHLKAWRNAVIWDVLTRSLLIALVSTAISTVLGTGLGIALQGRPFRGKKAVEALVHVPILMPEIVMGISLLVWFVLLRITLGTWSVVIAHVTFGMSYVVLTVRTRLEGFDRTLEEAARDLGATPWQAFTRVVLPWVAPGIASGALMAFTLSFDDFLVTFFVSGAGADTLPLKIYAMIKFGVSREVNAVSTWMLGLTLAAVLAVFGPFRKAARGRVSA